MVAGNAQDTGVRPSDGVAGVGYPAGPGAPGAAAAPHVAGAPGADDAAREATAPAEGLPQDAPEAAFVNEVEGGDKDAAVAEVDGSPNTEAEAEAEIDPLTQARAEADELRDRYVRLQAEWDNFRKRTTAERAQERLRAAEHLVERLLPIVDDLERAIEHSDTANEASLKEGIAAVYSKLSEVLQREGVKTINPIGEAFDANTHQAVGKEDNASVPDETVTQVYQKGYEMGDRVLRAAMVVVSQGGPKRETE
ncbi:MAG: nucleotide exchange factor GrpE [Coriobacteriales bacterium]|jgi:molecular chaperone GrpE|nr:nucleotide exchange factor GrpE [Coriobacteriales bacterium]